MEFNAEVASGGMRAARARKHVTQQDAANAVGVSRETIKNYENGSLGGASLKTMYELAEYYGCSLDELVGRK